MGKKISLSFFGFVVVSVVIVSLRLFVWEPFLIPSASMEPTLMVNDHILVNKLEYGIKNPVANNWLVQWGAPKRGDVVVFIHPEKDIYYIKRVVALPGEEIEFNKQGAILINGEPLTFQKREKKIHYQETSHSGSLYQVQLDPKKSQKESILKVPKEHVFVMGDSRGQSNDSRFWGALPQSHIVGKATKIWLSCETLLSVGALCTLDSLRMSRIGRRL